MVEVVEGAGLKTIDCGANWPGLISWLQHFLAV